MELALNDHLYNISGITAIPVIIRAWCFTPKLCCFVATYVIMQSRVIHIFIRIEVLI